MDFTYSIPLIGGGTKSLTLRSGSSAVVVGANGSGKSRLGSHLELTSQYTAITHRVGAQRALRIPPRIPMEDPDKAQHVLWYGHETSRNKMGQRWQTRPTTHLFNDYQLLLSALFSEEFAIAMDHKREKDLRPNASWPETALARVKEIWDSTIITRNVLYKGVSLYITVPSGDVEYPGDEMSDGERVLFYLVGQCLEAPPDGVIIIDEPELHIHKASLTTVWDKIETARPDCLFIYMTHDIEFATSRTAGQKFAVRSYDGRAWEIVDIPEEYGLPEDITTRILGSRKPILFVEGEREGKDKSVFGKIYDCFTVLPVGSCESVIHLTNSYNQRNELHHLDCCGIIDRDGKTDEEVEYLKRQRVHTIEFAELENLLLAEPVLREVAGILAFSAGETEERIDGVKTRLFQLAEGDVERTCVEFTKRRLGRALSTIGFRERTVEALSAEFDAGVKALDANAIYEARKQEMDRVIERRDYASLLAIYENKGAVKQIGGIFNLKANEYPDFVLRQVGSEGGKKLLESLRGLVPELKST